METELVIGMITMIALILAALVIFLYTRSVNRFVEMMEQALNNKVVLDEAERRYLEASLPVRTALDVFAGVIDTLAKADTGEADAVFDLLDKYFDKIRDGEPNTIPPAPDIHG